MPQREFDITIAPDGSVEIHVKGYKGKSCLEAMKIFEQIVGEMKSQRETSEFYEPEEVVGKTPFDFMTAEEAQRVGGMFSPVARRGTSRCGLTSSSGTDVGVQASACCGAGQAKA